LCSATAFYRFHAVRALRGDLYFRVRLQKLANYVPRGSSSSTMSAFIFSLATAHPFSSLSPEETYLTENSSPSHLPSMLASFHNAASRRLSYVFSPIPDRRAELPGPRIFDQNRQAAVFAVPPKAVSRPLPKPGDAVFTAFSRAAAATGAAAGRVAFLLDRLLHFQPLAETDLFNGHVFFEQIQFLGKTHGAFSPKPKSAARNLRAART